jgi:hypothetical protein
MRISKCVVSLVRIVALLALWGSISPTNAQQPVTLGPIVCGDGSSTYFTFTVDSTILHPGQMAHLTVTENGCQQQGAEVVGALSYEGPNYQYTGRDPLEYWIIQDQGGTRNPPDAEWVGFLDLCEEGIPCATTGELGIGSSGFSSTFSVYLYMNPVGGV